MKAFDEFIITNKIHEMIGSKIENYEIETEKTIVTAVPSEIRQPYKTRKIVNIENVRGIGKENLQKMVKNELAYKLAEVLCDKIVIQEYEFDNEIVYYLNVVIEDMNKYDKLTNKN